MSWSTVLIVALLVAIVLLHASRVGWPFRPRRIDVGAEQRQALEELLPQAEDQARARGMSEEAIAAKVAEAKAALPLAPEGLTLDEDGTALDTRKRTV